MSNDNDGSTYDSRGCVLSFFYLSCMWGLEILLVEVGCCLVIFCDAASRRISTVKVKFSIAVVRLILVVSN